MNLSEFVSRRRLFAAFGMSSAAVALAACSAPAASTAVPARPAEAPKAVVQPPPPVAAATKPADVAKPAEAAKPTEAAKPAATPVAAAPAAGVQKVQLLWWSHGAEEENKKTMIGKLNQSFSEKKGGNVTVQMTWTQMPGIWTQLRGAYTAGSGIPDVHWFGRDQFEWIKAGWIADMSEGINWSNVEPWAKKAFEYPGPGGKPGVFAVTEHASTGELLYNKAMFKDLGITVPLRGQFTAEEFKAIVKKIVESGKTPLANAIGDRNYPGTFMSNYALMAKLGPEDLVKLWQGETSWKDPRVVEALTFHEDLVKAKAYPSTFSSMTLSESHNFFHTQRKAAMFAVPSWYTARAFVPEDKGGQPKDFQLGFLSYPTFTDGKGKDTRFLDVGGAQSVSAKSKNIDLAKELLNGYTNSDFANEWASLTALRTATKTDPTKIKALFPDYWKDYYTSHDGVNAVAGADPGSNMKPGVLEAYTNVLNSGLPGGLLTAAQAAEKMDEARLKNK